MRFRAVGWLLYFSIFFLFTTPLRAEELYTRTDELSCGNTVVQAFTTCTEDSHDLDTAMCTDQHFLFINKATGASVRLEGSGDPTVDRYFAGGKVVGSAQRIDAGLGLPHGKGRVLRLRVGHSKGRNRYT